MKPVYFFIFLFIGIYGGDVFSETDHPDSVDPAKVTTKQTKQVDSIVQSSSVLAQTNNSETKEIRAELERVGRLLTRFITTHNIHVDYLSPWNSRDINYGYRNYSASANEEYCNHRVHEISARGTHGALITGTIMLQGAYDYEVYPTSNKVLHVATATTGTGVPFSENTWVEYDVIWTTISTYASEAERKEAGCKWPGSMANRDICVCLGPGFLNADTAKQYDCYGKSKDFFMCERSWLHDYSYCRPHGQSCDQSLCTKWETPYLKEKADFCNKATLTSDDATCKRILDTDSSARKQMQEARSILKDDIYICIKEADTATNHCKELVNDALKVPEKRGAIESFRNAYRVLNTAEDELEKYQQKIQLQCIDKKN